MPKGKPLAGDRSAYDAQAWPGLHANDTDTAVDALHHTLGGGPNQAAAGNHTHAHFTDTANPHNTTKAQVGLGNVANVLCNLAATAAPTVTDDSSKGYSVGSSWFDVTNDKAYLCLDATLGAAIWQAEHAKVTMSAAADVILSIGDVSQQITVDSQAANRVLAGPASGANAVPTFRALVEADIPAAISARAVRSSALSVVTSTWTSVPFASASWDNHPAGLSAQWDIANPTRLTCRLAGLYYIHGAAVFALHATGQRLIKLLKNGTEFYQDFRMPMAVFGTPIILSTLLYLAVGDYIEMQAWQNSGGNLDLSYTTPVPQLTITRLGL